MAAASCKRRSRSPGCRTMLTTTLRQPRKAHSKAPASPWHSRIKPERAQRIRRIVAPTSSACRRRQKSCRSKEFTQTIRFQSGAQYTRGQHGCRITCPGSFLPVCAGKERRGHRLCGTSSSGPFCGGEGPTSTCRSAPWCRTPYRRFQA